jgi:manganese transport protein
VSEAGLTGDRIDVPSGYLRGADERTKQAADRVLSGDGRRGMLLRLLPFFGPAFVASVAYVDPGNFATNISAGAKFGYLLLWVVVASNLMAMLVQTLAAKLGLATGRNLAETCREEFPRSVVWGMWVLAEVVAMATDLAEFLGAALGFYLLLHVPLIVGAIFTAIVTFAILTLERYGFRPLEVAIGFFVAIIAVCYLAELAIGHPLWSQVGSHALVPAFRGRESVLLAAGILGATVMPHVVYLHSGLTQNRIVTRDPVRLRKLFRFQTVDVVIAMTVAGLVNGAMLIMAAATFHSHGFTNVGTIEQAHRTLAPLLGSASAVIFAVALLASGLSSSTVGTMSGQMIMQGFVRRRIPVWLRRAVTMAPAFVVIIAGLDPTRTLVISQVVLSFGLPFAVIPLVVFTSRRRLMGTLTNSHGTVVLATIVSALIVALNVVLLALIFSGSA